MQTPAQRHQHPFVFYHYNSALSAADCRDLEQLFVGKQPWQHRSKGGYECALRDVTAEVSPSLKIMLIEEMRAVMEIPLMDHIQITAQLMESGQHVGEHSDHPQLGYEFARIILYLNTDWQPSHGGVLELLDGANGTATAVAPRYNHAFAFQLHAESYHRVSVAHQQRRSVVFNFWHPANSPELADVIAKLLAGMHLRELPEEMDPLVAPIADLLDEEMSFRASVAAIVLHRWGYDARTVTAAYYACAEQPWSAPVEAAAAIRLGVWVATLHQDIFDVEAWHVLVDEVRDLVVPAPLLPLWELCFPPKLTRMAQRST